MMQSTLILLLLCGGLGNLIILLVGAHLIFKRQAVANARCADQNRIEREASAREFKSLAERVTDALVHIGVKLSNLEERSTPAKGTTSILTKSGSRS